MTVNDELLDKAQVLLEQTVEGINALMAGYMEEHQNHEVPSITLAMLLTHLVTTYAHTTAEQKKPVEHITNFLYDLVEHAKIVHADVTDLITNPSLPSE